MRLLWAWDGLVFRILRALMKLIDTLVPFGRRQLVLSFLALYMLGAVGSYLQHHQSVMEFFWPLLLMAFIVTSENRVGTRPGREEHTPSLVFRLIITIWFLSNAALDLHAHEPWDALNEAAYVGLMYAIDMRGSGPRARRRVAKAVPAIDVRPGYSTA